MSVLAGVFIAVLVIGGIAQVFDRPGWPIAIVTILSIGWVIFH